MGPNLLPLGTGHRFNLLPLGTGHRFNLLPRVGTGHRFNLLPLGTLPGKYLARSRQINTTGREYGFRV